MRRLGRLLASVQVRLRLLIVLAWIGALVWVLTALAPIGGSAGTVSSVVPKNAGAITAERISGQDFAFPLITRTVVVVRNPRGLAAVRQARIVRLAASLTKGQLAGYGSIGGALPLVDELRRGPFMSGGATTALLYLYFRPGAGFGTRVRVAQRLVDEQIGHRPGEFEGVTGTTPAQSEQTGLIEEWLPWVELASLILVVGLVGVHFRSVGAALVVLAAVLGAYLVAERVVAAAARGLGLSLPAEIRPVLVVLVFGVATDYSIFYLSRHRALLAGAGAARDAGRPLVRQITPIVLAAGLTVAAGTAALSVAELPFLRSFGPGLAISVLVAMIAVAWLVPAALALLGRRLYWPGGVPEGDHAAAADTSAASEGAAGARDRDPEAAAVASPELDTPPTAGAAHGHRPLSTLPVRLAVRHPLIAALMAGALVLAGASGLLQTSVGNELVQGLPRSAEAHQAYEQAAEGFAPGALAPTVVVVKGEGVAARRASLARLQVLLEHQRGVAAVLGARQQPSLRRYGAVFSKSGGAARYLVFLRDDPLGPRALGDVRALESHLPALLARSGLRGTQAFVGGDSALSADLVDATLSDLGRVAPTMLAAIFLVVAIFLGALVAPAYLVLTSMLAALCALGLTTYVLQDLLGYGSVAYYVIFTVAVLLVSLGSDYNVFMVGRIWQEGRRAPVGQAVSRAATRAARPISVAGVLLAATFALLAIVPLEGFREIAFAMAVGLLVDTFVVRTILVPALIVLVGRRSAWPGHAFRQPNQPAIERAPRPAGTSAEGR